MRPRTSTAVLCAIITVPLLALVPGTASATPGSLSVHGNTVSWQTTVDTDRSFLCSAFVMDSDSPHAHSVARSQVQNVPPGGSVTMTMTVPDGHYYTGWACRRQGGGGEAGPYVPQEWVPIDVPG